MLLALAGAGYLRGLQDTKTTLIIAVVANVVNLALELFLVYGLDLGIAGSAWGTVVAQIGAAGAFLVIARVTARRAGATLGPSAAGVRETAVVGGHLIVRTGSLLIALLATTAIAARISNTALAAHQIAFQIWTFLALALDAIAIAGQALVGKLLGADDAPRAHQASRRMLELGIVAGIALGLATALLRTTLVPIFTDSIAVQHLTEEVLWFVIALQPVAAVGLRPRRRADRCGRFAVSRARDGRVHRRVRGCARHRGGRRRRPPPALGRLHRLGGRPPDRRGRPVRLRTLGHHRRGA